MDADLEGALLLGKLRVLRRIGDGGMGVVYEVEHVVTGHRRALKLLRSELALSGEAATRFVREAKIASLVQSPFLVDTLDAGRLPDGTAYVLMELAEGKSLRATLEEEGPLDWRRACRIALDACAGLEAVHGAGFVHRDVKPDNLLLTSYEGGERAMLLDFGLCKALEPTGVFETVTREGAAPGTPAYLAPERFEAGRALDPSADLWSLAVVLFEMVSGHRPFVGATAAAVIAAVQRGQPASLARAAPSAPEALARVVDRALLREPEERLGSAVELAAALREVLGEPATPARGQGAPLLGGRYRVVRPLGRGGSGAVFEVHDQQAGDRRALKLLHVGAADPRAIARLRREAALAARVGERAGLVRVHDLGEDPRVGLFLVMDLLEGVGLDALLARGGGLPRARCVELTRALGAALDALHGVGIVHRDVKPANLFLEGPDQRLRLLDLGIAKVLGEATLDATADGALIGTPAYAAPEQLEHAAAVGPSADRYSVAHVVYAMLVGRPYFDDEARAGVLPLLAAIGAGPTEPASVRARRFGAVLPPAFDAWFARAIARDVAARFPSFAALDSALAEALSDDPADVGMAVATARSSVGGTGRGRSSALAILGIGAAVGLLSVGLSSRSRRGLDEEAQAPSQTVTAAALEPARAIVDPPAPPAAAGPEASSVAAPTAAPTDVASAPRAREPSVASAPRAREHARPPSSAKAAAAVSAGVPAETFF